MEIAGGSGAPRAGARGVQGDGRRRQGDDRDGCADEQSGVRFSGRCRRPARRLLLSYAAMRFGIDYMPAAP